jgi:hypothetical protein
MEGIVFIAGAIAVGGLVAAVILSSRQAAQRRTEELTRAAERMGWGFREKVEFSAIPDLERFELFRSGHSKKLRNLATSPAGELRAVLFDYAYTISTGKSSHTRRQTVFYATGSELSLPSFSLRPEHFLHKVGAVFGYQDIDIDGHEYFSSRFLLRGEDEASVRAAFNSEVARFFERHPDSCAAGTGKELLFWRPGRLTKPEELQLFVNEGFELAQRFVQTPHR